MESHPFLRPCLGPVGLSGREMGIFPARHTIEIEEGMTKSKGNNLNAGPLGPDHERREQP